MIKERDWKLGKGEKKDLKIKIGRVEKIASKGNEWTLKNMSIKERDALM